MGNSLPLPLPCACVRHHEAGEVEISTAAAKKRRRRRKSRPARRRNVRAAARPRHVVPVADTPPPENGDGGEEEEEAGERFKEAWRPSCRVETVGCGEDGGGVRRVKIVMRRKDIAELVARLEQRDAEERSATVMEPELRHDDLGGDGDGSVNGGSVTMSPCRDAWRPRLSIIPENY